MAVHFDIKVNRRTVGHVVIKRRGWPDADEADVTFLESVQRAYWYDVECEYPLGRTVRTYVQHTYEAGAVRLIVESLAEVLRELAENDV